MVFEDAHWSDPTSRELLDLTVERVAGLRVLLIITFRPEFQPPWIGQPQVTMLALNRLGRRDRTAFVKQIAGGETLPNEVIDQITARTEATLQFVDDLPRNRTVLANMANEQEKIGRRQRIDQAIRLMGAGIEVQKPDGRFVRFIENDPRRPKEY
jgi:hypothetical protein